MLFAKRLIPIPPLLYAQDTGAPFARCLACDVDLLRDGCSYVIERAVRRNVALGASETIFEYAMCETCQQGLYDRFSDASRQHVEAYFRARLPGAERLHRLLGGPSLVERWLDRCIVTGVPRDELSEYQFAAFCEGDRLVLDYLPFLIGGQVAEELTAVLSTETKDELRGFVDDFFGVPPELRELLPDLAPMLL